MISKVVEHNFELLESCLWRCKECNTTFEDENECMIHLEEIGIIDEEKEMKADLKRKYG